MQSIFKIFQDLKNETPSEIDGFTIASLPQIKNHKIGLSKHGLPLFFIKCDNETNEKALDYNLESISIQFNQKCQLLSNDKKVAEGNYTIIALKTDSVDLQEYFLNILYFVVLKLPVIANLKELKIEVEKLISLFNKFSKLPTKTIQGLWAELLIVEQSSNPDYLINAWHYSSTDKFDFNDGIDKIEVKSTAKSRRIHSFSLEQLNPNKNSKLLIASVFAVETGKGKSVFDLVKSIHDKSKKKEVLFRINEVLLDTLGRDFEKAFDHFFDYQLAVDSLAFFDSELVPKIDISSITREISNVHFDCDLSKTQELKTISTNSFLHKCLIYKAVS
ncbi:PD-(D/E)XK motif protein [Chryseobacterium sp. H3056]|uniref:PD-(D/E)XK motif protein n=1 Tax=Kaistella daneshvariae TaxID=2487074 RepID=A0A3N0WYA0_9FLAO|nr:PD-(D/E)XK motif protein [Kaistella daneshvariae]ROI10070.1 PD-(D/E)XK motif protein [Kaistella daneshvariae]